MAGDNAEAAKRKAARTTRQGTRQAAGQAGSETASEEKRCEGVSLFDGRTFDGWEGDTQEDVPHRGRGDRRREPEAPVPRNEFLCTKESYGNFVLRAECKLIGPANGGIQFRSQRIPNNHEVSGYQADMSAGANGGYWGCLYDESRRNRMLARPDRAVIMKALKPNDWNLYEIRCEGPRIRLSLNGVQTVDYTETDAKIPTSGIIGLQIHGGGPARPGTGTSRSKN